jgi:hypothetical protein
MVQSSLLATAVFAVIMLVLIMAANATLLHKHTGGRPKSNLSNCINSGSGAYHFTGERPATCAAILTLMFFATKEAHDIHLPSGLLIVVGKFITIKVYSFKWLKSQ